MITFFNHLRLLHYINIHIITLNSELSTKYISQLFCSLTLISINVKIKCPDFFCKWIFIAKFACNKFFKLYVIICC